MNNIEIILKNIESEYQENQKQINELESKIKVLTGADIEYKASLSFAMSTIPWILSLLATPLLNKTGLNTDLLRFCQIAAPATIGFTTQSILLKNADIKKRLESFTGAKTQQEIITERAIYEVEQAYLKQVNSMLNQVHDSFTSKDNLLRSLSTEYNINRIDRETPDPNVLKEKYRESLQQLKVSTTRLYLHDKYYKQRDSLNGGLDYLLVPTMTSFISLVLIESPSIFYNALGQTPSKSMQVEILAIPIISSVASIIYLLKKNKNLKYSFNIINDTLDENKLPKKESEEEYEELNTALNQTMNDTIAIKIALEEQKTLTKTREI